ncbi:hypothetical protein BDR04DRAFT_1104181 [Suillus decipiens]|nr:hypothetical protein BDR04DRAFT_1104181 [Suillus decipiens]
MDYPVYEIAVARDVQFLAYIYTSMATFWIYDFVCSLHEEWTFLLRSRWTKVKGLYIIARYASIVFIIANFLASIQNEECEILGNISSYSGVTSLIFSESFFILRTYALWNNNRTLLVAVLSTLFLVVVSSITMLVITSADDMTSAIPGTSGCLSSLDVRLVIPFLTLSVFQLGLVCLTMIRVIKGWRSAKGPLYAMLVKHNIFYYACGLPFSTVNVLLPILSVDASQGYSVYLVLEGLQILVLAILATRMHLHLWYTEQHVDGSEALVYIPMSDMPPANYTV